MWLFWVPTVQVYAALFVVLNERAPLEVLFYWPWRHQCSSCALALKIVFRAVVGVKLSLL